MTQPVCHLTVAEEISQILDNLIKMKDLVERVTRHHIVLARGEEAIEANAKAQEAATLAATIVAEDESPDGAWVEEEAGFRARLAELCGMSWSPFKPIPCPLTGPQVEKGLAYLRKVIGLNMLEGREEAINFLTWAKGNSVDSR